MECAYDYVCLRLTRRSDQAVTGNRQYSHQDLCLIELWNTTTSKPLAAGLTTTPPKWSSLGTASALMSVHQRFKKTALHAVGPLYPPAVSPPVKARVRKGAKHGEA
jgi:hypothetical protein